MAEDHVHTSFTSPVPAPAVLERSVLQTGVDYANRTNLLRAMMLSANDGLISLALLIIVGVNQTVIATNLIAGVCSMAIGEYVSVCSQYDIEMEQIKREEESRKKRGIIKEENLPRPTQAAGASALAFALGGLLPLLSGVLVNPWEIRVVVVCVVTSLGLVGLGITGGILGGASVKRSAVRVLIGGLIRLFLGLALS